MHPLILCRMPTSLSLPALPLLLPAPLSLFLLLFVRLLLLVLLLQCVLLCCETLSGCVIQLPRLVYWRGLQQLLCLLRPALMQSPASNWLELHLFRRSSLLLETERNCPEAVLLAPLLLLLRDAVSWSSSQPLRCTQLPTMLQEWR